ncbi:MAG TPA: hypothetical protein VGL73_00250 [Caulobacteraceae bacterium]
MTTTAAPTARPRDILASRWRTAMFYGLPSLVIFASGMTIHSNLVTLDIESPWRGAIWAVSMGVMAAACLVNTLRCGRMHCYFTGPFLTVMALASLGYGLGALPLGPSGWNIIGTTTLVGAVVLIWLPEALLGRYRAGGTPG